MHATAASPALVLTAHLGSTQLCTITCSIQSMSSLLMLKALRLSPVGLPLLAFQATFTTRSRESRESRMQEGSKAEVCHHVNNDDRLSPQNKRRRYSSGSLSTEPRPAVQRAHTLLLELVDSGPASTGLVHKTLQLKNGRTKEYCEWWQVNQADLSLFRVRLIGNASEPERYTALACSDLGFFRSVLMSYTALYVPTKKPNRLYGCSEWGLNRIHDRSSANQALELVIPVQTNPDILQQAIFSLLCGEASFSPCNVEPMLVLANAVGVTAAECIKLPCIYAPCI